MINEWLWALNAPKMRFRPGLCPDPAGGAYSAPPESRPPSCVWEGRLAAGEGKGGEGKGREGEGGEGREMDPHNFENRSTPMV